jgi:hypothetical protein
METVRNNETGKHYRHSNSVKVVSISRIPVPKREKVARDWRRLHNEELHNLYTSLNNTPWSRVLLGKPTAI